MEFDSDCTIRDDLKPGDIGYLIHLQAEHYHKEFGYDLEFEALIARLFSDFVMRNDTKEKLWVVEKNERIVGCVALFEENETTARLRLLFLHPEARGNGMGKKLVKLATDYAEDAGYSSVVLMTEDILEAAGKIYRDLGYKIVKSEEKTMWNVRCQLQTYEKKLK
jgi:N-acetylglutamate synthase-like GNAT family acetyltransferase